MKKNLITLLILKSAMSFAGCPEGTGLEVAENFATSMLVPNCFHETYTLSANKKKNPDYEELCQRCRPNFIENTSKLGFVLKPQGNLIKELAIEEYSKTIGNLVTDLIKLRTAYSFSGKFDSSERACNLKTIASNLDRMGCNGEPIETIRKNAVNEVAYLLLKPSTNNDDALLDRRSFQKSDLQCSQMSESEILHLKSELLLDSLDNSTIEKLSTLSINDLSSAFEKKSSLWTDFEGHPFFSNLIKDQKSFSNFWKTIPKPVSKDSIKAHISKSTELLDQVISDQCKKSTDAYIKLACKDVQPKDFKQPRLGQSRIQIENSTQSTLSGENIDDGLLDKNLKLIKLCELKGTRDLNQELSDISNSLPTEYQSISLDRFKKDKYRNEIQSTREAICEIEKSPKDCKDDTSYSCRLQATLLELKKETSSMHRMANSSDKSINSLIRSVLGNPTAAPDKVSQVLIANGILPKSDGKYVEQPKVAEREPNYFQKAAASSAAPSFSTTTTSQAQRQTSSAPAYTNDNFYRPQAAEISQSTETAAYEAPISTSILQSMKDLSQINGEIARRLLGNNTQSQSSISRSDVRSIAESVLKDQQKTPPTTAMVDNAVDDFYEEINKKQSPVGGGFTQGHAGPVKQSQREIEAMRRAQMNKALEGMGQGSRDVAMANAASDVSVKVQEGKDKEAMSKVEVFTSADKLEKVNLAEILKLKGQKDAEGKRLIELVKKKENFILNVNKTSLLVKFNDSKDGFEIIRIGSSGSKIDDKVVSEVRSFIKENYSGVALSDLRKNLVQ